MPIPTLITDLSQTAGSNYPAGSDSPSVLDDVQRAHAGFIAQLRDGKGHTNAVTLASATTTDIGGQNSMFVEISGTNAITSLGTNYNGPRYLRFTGVLTLTYNATTINISSGASVTTAVGDCAIAIPNISLNGWNVQYLAGLASEGAAGIVELATVAEAQTGTDTARAVTAAGVHAAVGSLMKGYLFGCTMSTAGSSATMSIAAGRATDSAGVALMTLTAIAKTTSAWAVGTAAGGLDTGTIANSTWYHFYVIRRPDTGVVDVVFSTNATSPTLPTNYTQYRRIGSGFTNGSAQWTRFTQMGDLFEWYTPIKDIEASSPGTAAVTRTLSVPSGVVVMARVNAGINNSGVAVAAGLYLSALDTEDLAASTSASPLWGSGAEAFDSGGGSRRSYTQQFIRTNTSAQIRSRVSSSDANVTVRIVTLGWTDTRGRDA